MKTPILFQCNTARTAFFIFISLIIVACDKTVSESSTTPLNLEEIEAARVALVSWFECEECTENQLNTVLKYSEQLQPMLISALNRGASPASRELYKRELEKRYDELMVYSRSHPEAKPTLSKQDFVALYLGNLTAQYQTRAAQALSSIGGETSSKALQQALAKNEREDVRQVIKLSLQKIR